MNGDTDIFNIITQLKVLSKVREGQKISIRNGTIYLDRNSDGIASSTKRWYYGDGRHKTYIFVKNLMFNAIVSLTQTEEGDVIISAMKNSMSGINSLKVTYGDDDSVVAAYEVLTERMERVFKNNIV